MNAPVPSTIIARPGSSGHPVDLVIDGTIVVMMGETLAKEFMAALACDLRWRLGRRGDPQLPLAAHRRDISEAVALTLIADVATCLRQWRAKT